MSTCNRLCLKRSDKQTKGRICVNEVVDLNPITRLCVLCKGDTVAAAVVPCWQGVAKQI